MCRYGGSCELPEQMGETCSYTCRCKIGFSGDRCEIGESVISDANSWNSLCSVLVCVCIVCVYVCLFVIYCTQ